MSDHRPAPLARDASDLCLLSEVLRRLQISRDTYYKLTRQGRFPLKVFRFAFDDRPRFRRCDLEAFIAANGRLEPARRSASSRHASRLRRVK